MALSTTNLNFFSESRRSHLRILDAAGEKWISPVTVHKTEVAINSPISTCFTGEVAVDGQCGPVHRDPGWRDWFWRSSFLSTFIELMLQWCFGLSPQADQTYTRSLRLTGVCPSQRSPGFSPAAVKWGGAGVLTPKPLVSSEICLPIFGYTGGQQSFWVSWYMKSRPTPPNKVHLFVDRCLISCLEKGRKGEMFYATMQCHSFLLFFNVNIYSYKFPP